MNPLAWWRLQWRQYMCEQPHGALDGYPIDRKDDTGKLVVWRRCRACGFEWIPGERRSF